MRVQELGNLDGPVLLFGGPYSNLPATVAVIERAQTLGIAPDHMICTGDIVAYCADPAKTVALIRDLGCPVVAGNCEQQLAKGEMDCGCGFAAGSTCDLLSAAWYSHVDAAIGARDRAWMAALPDIATFTHNQRRCAVIHGGISDVSRFLWPTSSEGAFKSELDMLRNRVECADIVIAGHCGIAFQRLVGHVTWLNAGAIGLPANDGQTIGRFAVLENGRARIEPLSYDIDRARQSMIAAGLTQGYDRCLNTGYWPSEEVLPPDLRRTASFASG